MSVWNVRGLNRDWKLGVILGNFDKSNLDVMSLGETRVERGGCEEKM